MKQSAMSNDEVKEVENFVFEKEIEIALNQLNKGSSPGSDGLTTEFYKTFFYLIKSDLVEIYITCCLQKEMSETMKQATVKLIFKKNDKMQLKNWRPISLLNTDYKSLSKLLANSITLIMNNIISTNQKCGLRNRRIEQILINVQAAFEIAEEKNETLGFFLGDFEKAFDRLSHEFVFKIIKTLGFGQNMQNWIKLLYKNIYSNVEY